MGTSNTGGDNGSGSDSTASLRQKPDISAELRRLQESLKAWKRLMAEGEVESLVVKIDPLPELAGSACRMLTAQEQRQLLATKRQLSNYLQRIQRHSKT